ncbi:MAG: ROK family protein [Clostridia bacterium]|nr:ROK family protein [Clostridia bacterium]
MKNLLVGAVDVGGTKILLGICDADGRVLSRECFPTRPGAKSAEDSVVDIANALKRQAESIGADVRDLSGVGIVCAGPVDPVKGIVENPYTLGWNGYPITDRLRELTGLPVRLENDANGVLLGEVALRSIQSRRVLMMTFGTGIGVAIFMDGKLYRSGGRFHPEMGHMIVASQGPECYCRHRGCFESLWSGASINRRAQEIGYADFDELHAAWQNGCEKACAFMQIAKREFVAGVWNLMSIVKPNTLILGGGLMMCYFDMAKKWIEEDTRDLSDFLEPFEIVKAGEQGLSALTGAARLILDRQSAACGN